jgi:transitional endoplasmic reticulum ATPase
MLLDSSVCTPTNNVNTSNLKYNNLNTNIGTGGDSSDTAGSVQDRALSTLLNEMDGIESSSNVFMIACTNRPDLLDEALIRPGRLSSHVYVALPDWQTRIELLALLQTKMPIASTVNRQRFADQTSGLSCIAIKNIVRYTRYLATQSSNGLVAFV